MLSGDRLFDIGKGFLFSLTLAKTTFYRNVGYRILFQFNKLMFFSNSLENQLQRWNETIRNQPKNPNAYTRRGMVNFQLAKIDESIRHLRKRM